MPTLMIVENKIEVKKIEEAVFKKAASEEYFPEALEDEESNGYATLNDNGQYKMSNIYETKFDLMVKMNETKMIHGMEQAGIVSYPIDMSEQDDQIILGIREDSVQAFWKTNGQRKPITRSTEPQTEYVNIRVDSSLLQIQLSFDNKEEADHFEFEFKILTKLEPKFTDFQYDVDNENYEICDYFKIKKLDTLKNDEICISDNQKFTFMETTSALHNNYNYIDNGMAGRLNAKPADNVKFHLTTAEIHLNSYYRTKMNQNDEIYCIVSNSSDSRIRCFALSASKTIDDLTKCIMGDNQPGEFYLMTKERQRPYNPVKPLSEFPLQNGCIFFRFQKPKR